MSTKRPKQTSKEMYIQTSCQEKGVRQRRVVYVSEQTHQRLRKISYMYGHSYVTLTSLVESILNNHLKQHKQSYKEYISKPIIP